MSSFDDQTFEKKLVNLKDTQESVSQLSYWCLQNKQHHKRIVNTWLHVLKKVKVESRLTLFHLANDVIQYSKRKNLEFVESWGTALQRATTMVRDEKVQKKILRIFKIWGDRNIYEETFLADLCGLLTTTPKKSGSQSQSQSQSQNKSHQQEKPQIPAGPLVFEPQNLFVKIRTCASLESDTDAKMRVVNECHLALNDVDSLRASLKDRKHGDDAVAEVEDAIQKMKEYEQALRIEVQERRTLIDLLKHGEVFYENERGEAKVVFNAYRNFGSRVKSVKRKLDELIPTLSSPIPSPDVNAPSPSPDSDIELPNDEDLSEKDKQAAQPILAVAPGSVSSEMESVENCFTSFMGSSSLPFDIQRNFFENSTANQSQVSPPSSAQADKSLSPNDNSEGKPIEVISMRSKADEDSFDIGDFLKSLATGSSACNSSGGIPGLGDPLPVPPPVMPITSTATSYPTYSSAVQPTPVLPPPAVPMVDSYAGQTPVTSERADGEELWKTTLPPKFPTWQNTVDNEWERDSIGSDEQDWVPALPVPKVTSETPDSPPHFEKQSFGEPVEYDETSVGTVHGGADVDHRMLVALSSRAGGRAAERSAQSTKDTDHRILNSRFKKDVDHRNLISLTGSPAQDILAPPPSPPMQLWSHDQDYRSIPMPPNNSDAVDHDYRVGRPQLPEGAAVTADNVESVDMEMSDDDDDYPRGTPHHEKKMMPPSGSWHHDKQVPAVSEDPYQGSVIPTLGSRSQPTGAANSASRFPPPPPPLPPPIPRPDFRTDMRVPPPPMDFLPMGPPVQDAYGGRSPGPGPGPGPGEPPANCLGDVVPPPAFPMPPDFPVMHETPPSLRGAMPLHPPLPVAPHSRPSPNAHGGSHLVRTSNLRLSLRSPQRRVSRDSPPVGGAPSALSARATPPSGDNQDPSARTPHRASLPLAPPPPLPLMGGELPSGPEESDTDSMEQYMNTVGLSDDEDFKAIVGAMDPQFIRDVVEGSSRNGVDVGDPVSNGERPQAEASLSPKDNQTSPAGTPTPLLSLHLTPDAGASPASRGAFTPRGRAWKQRGGRGASPAVATPPRFPATSPGWGAHPPERSPFHGPHGRGRPGFRGVPRGMPFRTVMRGNPRFGGW